MANENEFQRLAKILAEEEGPSNSYVKNVAVKIGPLPEVGEITTYKKGKNGPIYETKYKTDELTNHALVTNPDPIGYIDDKGKVYPLDTLREDNFEKLYNAYPVGIDFLKENYEIDGFDIDNINETKESITASKKQKPVMLFPVKDKKVQELIEKYDGITLGEDGKYKLKTPWGEMEFSDGDYVCLYQTDKGFTIEYAVGAEDLERTYKPWLPSSEFGYDANKEKPENATKVIPSIFAHLAGKVKSLFPSENEGGLSPLGEKLLEEGDIIGYATTNKEGKRTTSENVTVDDPLRVVGLLDKAEQCKQLGKMIEDIMGKSPKREPYNSSEPSLTDKHNMMRPFTASKSKEIVNDMIEKGLLTAESEQEIKELQVGTQEVLHNMLTNPNLRTIDEYKKSIEIAIGDTPEKSKEFAERITLATEENRQFWTKRGKTPPTELINPTGTTSEPKP